jgi:signal peptide peptidase SppA
MSFRALRRAILGANRQPLLIEPGRADVLKALGVEMARGAKVSDEQLAEACGADWQAELEKQAAILAKPQIIPTGPRSKTALVSFRGLVTYERDLQPVAVSSKLFARTMAELAADKDIKTIVVMLNSPGGSVTGTMEAADALYAARETKRVVALVDPLCASAAYWIASQATEISAVPSANVGSIGVYMTHVDCSAMNEQMGLKVTYIFAGERKIDGNADEPLTDEARANFQAGCDEIYADFLAAVARGRGQAAAQVRSYGDGRVFSAREAKKLGLIDRVETADDAARRLGLVAQPQEEARRAEIETPDIAAEAAATEQQPTPEPAGASPDAAADLDRRRRLLELA